MCVHVPSAVDAGANRRFRYVAGDCDGELDDHLGGEHGAGRDIGGAAEGVNDASPRRRLEHGAGRGWCVGSWRLMGSEEELGDYRITGNGACLVVVQNLADGSNRCDGGV